MGRGIHRYCKFPGGTITGVTHTAGEASATLTFSQAFDDTNDFDTDTLAAATSASIYDATDQAMDTTPLTITGVGAGPQQLVFHPSGLDSTLECSPTGGVWADILDSDDGDTTYADCYSWHDETQNELYPATFRVDMDDPSGLESATISQLMAKAVVNVTDVNGGGGPSGSVAYLQICYDTGGVSQECSALYDLDGTEGYMEIWVGNTVDPDGNLLDMDDLINLGVEVTLNAEECCGYADGTVHVTEVYGEVEYSIPSDDSDPPEISGQSPANGTIDVDPFSDITFTLSDSGSGVDWMSFEIQLTGDKGYSKLYTDVDVTIVSKTGTPASYNVTVNPDVDFGEEEVITVTVSVDDLYANSLTHPAWSFTTGAAPLEQTITLWPSGVVDADSFLISGGGWADVLDSDDGDSTLAYKCCDGFTKNFYVAMDDTGLGSANIVNLTIHVVARYVSNGGPTNRPSMPGNIDIGFRTGTGTRWDGSMPLAAVSNNFDYVSSQTFNKDSDDGALDLADIENLQVTVKWETMTYMLRVTEVYVVVTYSP